MNTLQHIQSVPQDVPHDKATVRTVEEQHEHEFELFRTDAAMTVISAFGWFVSGLAFHVADMVELSAKSEYRAKYGILHDYTQEPNTLTACATIRKAIKKWEKAYGEITRALSRNSPTVFHGAEAGTDAGEDFMARVDNADEEFKAEYEAIRRQIIQDFRICKCSDPQMFYPLLNAIFMAGRFAVMSRYVASFAQGFQKGEIFAHLLHLNVYDPLQLLAQRLNLTDRDGHPLHMTFSPQEHVEYMLWSQKKHIQKRHAANPPVVIDVHSIFRADHFSRLSWTLETHMMELKTIDRLILLSEGKDPMYRKDYSMKHIQSCVTTFEQAMVNNAIHMHKWKELPRRMREYIDSVNALPAIDPRRRPKPVVCFRLTPQRDKQGNVIYNRHTKRPEYDTEFIGIWNSSHEAQREWGTPWQAIQRSVKYKAVNDGRNNVWLSLDDYLSMTYNTLLDVHPDIAAEFRRLIPELKVRTSREIADGTEAPQGTLNEAAGETIPASQSEPLHASPREPLPASPRGGDYRHVG